mmetsp:Transcript_14752/g.18583  ORF Transcript_14752/g.18583 Transcript_14752/m.18583 type:complete len:628 (-) Transcript_14752:69-1952(-)
MGEKSKLSFNGKVRKCLSKLKPHIMWIMIAQIMCLIFCLVAFIPFPIGLVNPATGTIINQVNTTLTEEGYVEYPLSSGVLRPVVAATAFQMFCLGVSRISAYTLYPFLIIIFATKMRAINNFLNSTPIGNYLDHDVNELHRFAGIYIAFDVWVHTLFHCIRWGVQGNISLLWSSYAGISGLIAVIATPLITFPMMWFRKSIKYEVRKALHYLFYVFAISLCWHVPVSGLWLSGYILPVLGTCICMYTLDVAYVVLFMTEKVEGSLVRVGDKGIFMSMDVSDTFNNRLHGRGGYVFINLPWVNRNQWHAFSLFEHPNISNRREVYIQVEGDWTTDVSKATQKDTVRTCWIQGPFISPYNDAPGYDNLIVVASGIGITPGISVVRNLKDTRRVCLIWMVRDPAMLEFFLEKYDLGRNGWNLIFYTGTAPLSPIIDNLSTNLHKIIKKRPNLNSVIPNIIYGIESGEGRPEDFSPANKMKDDARASLIHKAQELDQNESLSADALIRELSKKAREEKYLLSQMVGSKADSTFEAIIDERSNPAQRPSRRRRAPSAAIFKTLDQNTDAGACDFQPWEDNSDSVPFVKDLCQEYVLSRWAMTYCGGSLPVEKALNSISKEYGIDIKTELFGW